MARSTVTRTANRNAETLIAGREPFIGSNFSATDRPGNYPDTGRLNPAWSAVLLADRPTYVVYSYGTPIAWVSAGGVVRVPDAKYSVTTSRHQSSAAAGLVHVRTHRDRLPSGF